MTTVKSQKIRKMQIRHPMNRHRKGPRAPKKNMALRNPTAMMKEVEVSSRTIWPISQLTLIRGSCVPRFSKSESINGELWRTLRTSMTSVFSCSTVDP